MKLLLSILLLLFSFIGITQVPDPVEPPPTPPIIEENHKTEEEIMQFVEVQPQFQGGEAAMHKFIVQNVKYPAIDRESGIQGKVYVKFVVEVDGSITHIEIVRGVSKTIDAECIRVIKKMPKWIPGEQAGKKVRCRYTLPFAFKLG